jgi:4-carboxymuconolactone decarboxylase
MERNMKTRTALAAMALAATAGWLLGNIPAKSRPPRFAQLTMADIGEEQKPMVKYILSVSRVGLGGPYNLFLRSPGGGQKMLDLLDYLRFHSSVPARLNEFVILTQGRRWRSQVEWFAHVPIALKAGLSPHVVEELRLNKRPTTMQADEAAVYDFIMELYAKHTVSDPTYDRLHGFLNDQQIVDLTMTSGVYDSLAAMMAMGELGVPPGGELPFKPGQP